MMRPLLFRVSEKYKQLLEKRAAVKGTSVSVVVRDAIEVYFNSEVDKPNAAEVLLRWAKRKSRKRIKTSLDSTNYKEYLYGKKSLY